MNPWEFLAWVGAACAALVTVGFTAFLLVSMLRGLRNGSTK